MRFLKAFLCSLLDCNVNTLKNGIDSSFFFFFLYLHSWERYHFQQVVVQVKMSVRFWWRDEIQVSCLVKNFIWKQKITGMHLEEEIYLQVTAIFFSVLKCKICFGLKSTLRQSSWSGLLFWVVVVTPSCWGSSHFYIPQFVSFELSGAPLCRTDQRKWMMRVRRTCVWLSDVLVIGWNTVIVATPEEIYAENQETLNIS